MQKKNDWRAWLYLAPVIILLAVFIFYPLISTIAIAFTKDYNYTAQSGSGFTFDNFATIFETTYVDDGSGNLTAVYSDVVKYAIPNTLIIVFVTVPVSIILALLISVGLNSIKFLKKIFQTIFFMPYVTNAIAVGMVFSVIFMGGSNGDGLWNTIFQTTGYTWVDQGAPASRAMLALCVYSVWHALPFKILIFLSGLQNIDKQYYDAAMIDSAGKMKIFSSITVPLLSPQILYIMITSFIGSFKEYSSVVGLFGRAGTLSGYNNMYTIVYYIYDTISLRQVQYGCAAAVMLFVVILIFTAIQFAVSSKRVYY